MKLVALPFGTGVALKAAVGAWSGLMATDCASADEVPLVLQFGAVHVIGASAPLASMEKGDTKAELVLLT